MKSLIRTIKLLKNPALFVAMTLVVSLFLKANDISPTDRKMLSIMNNSGLASQYPIFVKIVDDRRQEFYHYPSELVSLETVEYGIFTFMRKSLSEEEIDQLYKHFKNPFLSKISSQFFKPIEDEIKFEVYIAKHGRKAKTQKVDLITQTNQLLHSDSYLFNFRAMIERAIKTQQLKRSPEHANATDTDLERIIETHTAESLKGVIEGHPKFMLQSLYYKTRLTTEIELSEFNRQFGNDKLLTKFYNLYQSAVSTYSKSVFEKLVPKKKSTK